MLVSSNPPKGDKKFWRISALDSKMGQIKKVMTHANLMLTGDYLSYLNYYFDFAVCGFRLRLRPRPRPSEKTS